VLLLRLSAAAGSGITLISLKMTTRGSVSKKGLKVRKQQAVALPSVQRSRSALLAACDAPVAWDSVLAALQQDLGTGKASFDNRQQTPGLPAIHISQSRPSRSAESHARGSNSSVASKSSAVNRAVRGISEASVADAILPLISKAEKVLDSSAGVFKLYTRDAVYISYAWDLQAALAHQTILLQTGVHPHAALVHTSSLPVAQRSEIHFAVLRSMLLPEQFVPSDIEVELAAAAKAEVKSLRCAALSSIATHLTERWGRRGLRTLRSAVRGEAAAEKFAAAVQVSSSCITFLSCLYNVMVCMRKAFEHM
jgi:hypothetical protein